MTPFVSVARGLCVLVLATSAFVPSSAPQDVPKTSGGPALQRFAEGLTVGDLLSTWTAETGRKFVVREEGGLRQRRLTLTAPPQYAAADADYVFESMLSAAGLALSPAGPADAKLFVVENVERPPDSRQRARFVSRDRSRRSCGRRPRSSRRRSRSRTSRSTTSATRCPRSCRTGTSSSRWTSRRRTRSTSSRSVRPSPRSRTNRGARRPGRAVPGEGEREG